MSESDCPVPLCLTALVTRPKSTIVVACGTAEEAGLLMHEISHALRAPLAWFIRRVGYGVIKHDNGSRLIVVVAGGPEGYQHVLGLRIDVLEIRDHRGLITATTHGRLRDRLDLFAAMTAADAASAKETVQ